MSKSVLMKAKAFLLLAVFAGLGFTLNAKDLRSGQKEIILAYTYQNKYPYKQVYKWGLLTPGFTRLGMGVCFTTQKLKPYVGAYVTKVRFYSPETRKWEATFQIYNSFDIPSVYPFPSFAERQVLHIKEGWNEITLQNPIKIDGKRIIFPAIINISDDVSPWVGVQDIDTPFEPMASYVYDEGGVGRKSTWKPSSESYFGRLHPFPIQLVLAAPENMKDVDEDRVAVMGAKVNGYYPNTINKIPAEINISNVGPNEVRTVKISYTYNGVEKKTYTETLNVNLPSSGIQRRQTVNLSLNAPALGRYPVVFKVESVNSNSANEVTVKQNSAGRRIHIYDPQNVFPRTMLVERTATTSNGLSPIYADSLQSVLAQMVKENKAIIVEHHFSNQNVKDQYALPEGKDDFFSAYGLQNYPYMFLCLNREPLYAYSEVGPSETLFSFPEGLYDNKYAKFADYLKTNIINIYDKVPGLAKVNVQTVNEEAGKIQVKVSGTLSNSVSKNPKKIILMFVEDSLDATGQSMSNPDPNFKQNNVLISFLTRDGGEVAKVNGNQFTYTSPKIDFVPKGKNPRIIALAMDQMGSLITDAYVMNAASVNIAKALSTPIFNANKSNIHAFVENGKVRFNDPTISGIEVYDLNGGHVNNQNLSAGIYVVKAWDANHTTLIIRKVIVK